MGDLANMTDCDGRVNGHRFLRWLRSRAETEYEREDQKYNVGDEIMALWHAGRRNLLDTMADDLERELTPPDYPEDDDDAVDPDPLAFLGRPKQE